MAISAEQTHSVVSHSIDRNVIAQRVCKAILPSFAYQLAARVTMTVLLTKFATDSTAFVLKSVKLSLVHREPVAKALNTKLCASVHLDNEAILLFAVSKVRHLISYGIK